MPLLVDTPVVPECLGEIKGVRDEGVCKVGGEMVGTGIEIPISGKGEQIPIR